MTLIYQIFCLSERLPASMYWNQRNVCEFDNLSSTSTERTRDYQIRIVSRHDVDDIRDGDPKQR